mmetsp:Transcript_17355/g.59913  ORF Transcript_17355/g.59913 Transcript_17355/m.59913 type:complete len:288 (-) Transcript_17355:103-966(-)
MVPPAAARSPAETHSDGWQGVKSCDECLDTVDALLLFLHAQHASPGGRERRGLPHGEADAHGPRFRGPRAPRDLRGQGHGLRVHGGRDELLLPHGLHPVRRGRGGQGPRRRRRRRVRGRHLRRLPQGREPAGDAGHGEAHQGLQLRRAVPLRAAPHPLPRLEPAAQRLDVREQPHRPRLQGERVLVALGEHVLLRAHARDHSALHVLPLLPRLRRAPRHGHLVHLPHVQRRHRLRAAPGLRRRPPRALVHGLAQRALRADAPAPAGALELGDPRRGRRSRPRAALCN